MLSLMEAFVVLAPIAMVASHPQCLDFTFPFTPSQPLLFCDEYVTFGCCTQASNFGITSEFDRIVTQLQPEERTACEASLKTLLCQKCSPYAAHIYDAENLPDARPFPGLCPSFCLHLLSKCSVIVKHLINDSTLIDLVDQKDYTAFCQATRTIDADYCYPNLKQNPALSNDLGTVEYFKTDDDCISVCFEEIDSGFSNALSLKHARDGTHRMFVVEQIGIVWIYLPDNTRLEPPFLDLRGQVYVNKRRGDERGLLDIEFHPNYKRNGLFYLHYSFRRRSRQFTRVTEMKVLENDMNRANISSERVLLEIFQPAINHNGGQLLFRNDDQDKYLYIFTGDGGLRGDPFGSYGNAQNMETFLGKILRIDVDSRGEDGEPYGIPPDNPFVNDKLYLPEIYALGVRNIWRCSSDRGDPTGSNRGRIICGDVGQNRFEEVDIIEKGGNYGWRGYEGNYCYDKKMCNSAFIKNYIPPIHVYGHSVGKSVTGGYVYRGCQNPNLRGKYIFGDYQTGKLFSLLESPSGQWDMKPICPARPDACLGKLKNSYSRYILAFGESESGELYVLSTSNSRTASPRGSIYKIVDPSRGNDPEECRTEIVGTVLSPGTRKISSPSNQANNGVTVRLIGSSGQNNQGRVEVLYRGKWGAICADQWDTNDAAVVCRMLGFESKPVGVSQEIGYRTGMELIWLSKLSCKGSEKSIEDCRHGGWGNTTECGVPLLLAFVNCPK